MGSGACLQHAQLDSNSLHFNRRFERPASERPHNEAEAVVIAAAITDQIEIGIRQRERGQQIARRNVAWKTVEALSLGVGEQTNRHDSDSG